MRTNPRSAQPNRPPPEPAARLADVVDASILLVRNAREGALRLLEGITDDARDVIREARALRQAAREEATRLRAAGRAIPRGARVARELLRLAAAYRLDAVVRPARDVFRGARAGEIARERLHRLSAERLHALCVELRGGVLKVGQFASTRVDLLPPAYAKALTRLQDQVPPLPVEAMRARIADELGPRARALEGLEEDALAAASLAQVHGAHLADGSRVAVKVQIPGIESVVAADLAGLRVAAPAFSDLVPGVDLTTFVRELSSAVSAELDYTSEARSAAAFAAAFAGDPEVVVPRIYPELSSERVLVMERLDGERLPDWLEATTTRGEKGARQRDQLLGILLRVYCSQVLDHGLLQADPHPGNFLVLPGPQGPRLGLLDFGCVHEYTPERRRTWAQLGLAILARDEARLGLLFVEAGFRSRDDDLESLRGFAELLLERFREGVPLEGGEAAQARLFEAFALLRDNPIVRVPADFVAFGRVFAALGGLILRWRPRIDLFATLAPRLLGAAAPLAASSRNPA
ncbi:MAG TPA: AarF/UbiB family protein [Myxococcota bacterium]|nr:AarF/UbiB family protein [Myxococcota bacterium]